MALAKGDMVIAESNQPFMENMYATTSASKFRPPPAGFAEGEFRLCLQFQKNGSCRLGSQCIEAHGIDELDAWVASWKIRRDKINKKIEKSAASQTFLQKLQIDCNQSDDLNNLFVSNLPFAEVQIEDEVQTTLTTKPAATKWTIWVKSSEPLRNIALLEDNHRENFTIHSVVSHLPNVKHGNLSKSYQEWNSNSDENLGILAITVKFRANVFGSFSQAVIIDFGCKPYISKQLRVNVYPAKEGLELSEDGKQLTISSEQQWTDENSTIIRLPSSHWDDHSRDLRERYPRPGRKLNFPIALEKSSLNAANYQERMHTLLNIEELAQNRILSNFNLTGNVILTTHYILSPGPLSTAKYCNGVNELFAKLELNTKISEDTPAGRLILNNCNVAFISFGLDSQGKRRAYECFIEDKTKDAIYLRLHEQLVADFQLKHGSEFRVQAQFQLNRDTFCEKHWAIDMCTTEVLFPATDIAFTIASSFTGDNENFRQLNIQQQQAVMAIHSSPGERRAPIVIAGPYGTGKTFTFAQCIKGILDLPNTRVLVCTHSNSAADLYVKDYLHPLVQSGLAHYRPLRIFYRLRWLATVHHSVIEYSLMEKDPTKGCSFRIPTLEEIEQHRIIITTLSTTNYLLQAGVKKDYFTHILIDEAAQCTECDTLVPLSLADVNTRIALAGDHMQLSPEVFSQVAREQQFQVSLLERLYDRYPSDFPCRIVLCDNYRSHSAIVKFTSELFYDNRLKAVGRNDPHSEFFPLTFRVAKGEDVQDSTSTSYFNMAEMYEVGEVVKKLQDSWPSESWGRFDENSIGVVSPYSDQVSRLRVHLRHSKLFGINVERVLNVQGKQFRVIILSTVRTRNTCVNEAEEKKRKKKNILKPKNEGQKAEDQESDEEEDKEDEESQFGFLSSARLLNTAVTRARSLVVVVGDPLALCSVGKCRKLWERYLEVCRDSNSLNGLSWSQLRSHLDALEMKKLYGLNPMAPEFVPTVLRAGQPLIMASQHYSSMGLPHSFYPNPPPPSSASIANAVAAAGFPPFPPPPPFHQQQWLGSPRRQPNQVMNQTRNVRTQILPFNKTTSYNKGPHTGPLVPPPAMHHMHHHNTASHPFANINSSSVHPPLPHLNTPFQNSQGAPRFSTSGHGAPPQLHELHSLRGFDISYSNSMSQRDQLARDAASPAQRAVSKPLTVQQLEAALLKQCTKVSPEPEPWSASPNNGSIWTPLSSSSLWDGGAIFTKEEEANKNDSSVPLYLRTSTTNSQLSENEMDLLVNSFVTTDGVGSDDDEEDIPLWADGNQGELDEDLEDILEGKTLQFEESVLRSLRNENLID